MRRKTNTVRIGEWILSSDQPVMIQSMLNTSTMDTNACVEQAIRIIKAGGQLVRITAPGVREAENLAHIHRALRERGFSTPLSADIHFTPAAAAVAACYVEKVRINPGNFADKRATFQKLNYTDEEYACELDALEKKFIDFLRVCQQNGTAVRIGTNHGSLSDRIMSRYGDTPAGMVEATMEYLRVCKKINFENVVISLKSSDCRIMVDAVRLLVQTMEREDMHYPLHLGVTEAGEGEDGRIRSAIGIGTLLCEGIGDTIRVSLTEAPEAEIPVARKLVDFCTSSQDVMESDVLKGSCSHPWIVADLSKIEVMTSEVWEGLDVDGVKAPEGIYVEKVIPQLLQLPEKIRVVAPLAMWKEVRELHALTSPLCTRDEYLKREFSLENQNESVWIQLTDEKELDSDLIERLREDQCAILVLSFGLDGQAYRSAYRKLMQWELKRQTLVRICEGGEEQESRSLKIAARIGGLFLDRLPGGIWLTPPQTVDPIVDVNLSRSILQSAGVRRYKAEFISCPGCGRTLYDLQTAVAKVKQAFGHMYSLKIAVMGCIVNGPGEMGDADFGYVGAGNGKVNLYRGKQMVRVAVPEEEAIEALKQLIEEDGKQVN